MANLRKEARGRECQVRIYGVCNGNPETTVLAHYRMAGICGTGMKPDDLIGAWACSACHDEIDRRTHNLDNKDARLYHLEGVIRTQAILLKEGKIKPRTVKDIQHKKKSMNCMNIIAKQVCLYTREEKV